MPFAVIQVIVENLLTAILAILREQASFFSLLRNPSLSQGRLDVLLVELLIDRSIERNVDL